jgi:hypothetical protein
LVCLEWGTIRALAAGATQDEITDVLLAIAPVAGLGRAVGAVTDVAAALGYDIEAALVDPDDQRRDWTWQCTTESTRSHRSRQS